MNLISNSERSNVVFGDLASEHSSADNIHQSTSTPSPVSDLHGFSSSSNPLSPVGMPAITGTQEESSSNTLSQSQKRPTLQLQARYCVSYIHTFPFVILHLIYKAIFIICILLSARRQHSVSGVKAYHIPRYPGDMKSPHVSTPRRAKRCLEITKTYIRQQKRRLSSTQQQLRQAKQRIKTLEDIISNLRDRRLITEDITEKLMVRSEF